MKIWTIYRFQAGDPRERWLRVGQLGTETEQNAIAAALAIWGDGSENHWLYAAELRMSADELPPFTATKSGAPSEIEIDYNPLAGASDADPLEDHGEAIRELYGRLDVLARHVAEIEKTREADGKDWREWRRETNENVDELTYAAASLENSKASVALYWALAKLVDELGKAVAGNNNRTLAAHVEADKRLRELEERTSVVIGGNATATQEQAEGIRGTRRPPKPFTVGGAASVAFNPTFTTIDSRPKSWHPVQDAMAAVVEGMKQPPDGITEQIKFITNEDIDARRLKYCERGESEWWDAYGIQADGTLKLIGVAAGEDHGEAMLDAVSRFLDFEDFALRRLTVAEKERRLAQPSEFDEDDPDEPGGPLTGFDSQGHG